MCSHGTETVAFTYPVWALKTKAPSISDTETRNKFFDTTKDTMAKKVKVPPEYTVYIKALKDEANPMDALAKMKAEVEVKTDAV